MIELKLGPDKILPIFDYRKPVILKIGWHNFDFSSMRFLNIAYKTEFYVLDQISVDEYTFTEIIPRTMKKLRCTLFSANTQQHLAQQCLEYYHDNRFGVAVRCIYTLYQFESAEEFMKWFDDTDKSQWGYIL